MVVLSERRRYVYMVHAGTWREPRGDSKRIVTRPSLGIASRIKRRRGDISLAVDGQLALKIVALRREPQFLSFDHGHKRDIIGEIDDRRPKFHGDDPCTGDLVHGYINGRLKRVRLCVVGLRGRDHNPRQFGQSQRVELADHGAGLGEHQIFGRSPGRLVDVAQGGDAAGKIHGHEADLVLRQWRRRVPRSAGTRPGPACHRVGGTLPYRGLPRPVRGRGRSAGRYPGGTPDTS